MASGSGGFGGFGTFGDRQSRPYRKHRPLPALLVIAVLCVGALIVWLNAISNTTDINEAIRCEPAASPPAGVTFTSLNHNALDQATPIAPDKVAVKVLNAGSTRGQGAITTENLRALGFTQIAEPDNDPAYAHTEPTCRGQIRFGESGISAARTMSLVTPCLELIKDTRQDASIDLALGETFQGVQPKLEAKQILEQLTKWSAQNHGGGEQSDGDTPLIDQALLDAARNVSC